MSDLGRLRWRCRRGTRELDRLLGGWLDAHYADSDAAARHAFDRLLDVQDPELWGWLSGASRPSDPDFARLVDEIRAVDRV